MRFPRSLGIAAALVASALVGGTLIGSAVATDEATEAETTTSDTYCDVFMDTLAEDLGVTRESLVAAGRAAANAAVDAAVEAGDLSDERAEALRERIAEADGAGCGWFGKGFVRGYDLGFHRGAVRGFLGGDVFEAAADALDLSSDELLGDLRDAGSLQAVAQEQGVSYDEVKASILAAIQADLDAAVEEGLPQDRADEILSRVISWLDEGGNVGDRPGLGIGRHHPGVAPWGGFGPWGGDDGSSDAEDAGA